jgi:hypothetical protein
VPRLRKKLCAKSGRPSVTLLVPRISAASLQRR